LGVAEEAAAVIGLELGEAAGDGSLEFVQGAGGGLSRVRFELGEGEFNRAHVRAVEGSGFEPGCFPLMSPTKPSD
jgi:hypothetical protein